MRIRKSAARLLGSAPPYSFSYAPPEYDWTPKFEPDPPTPMQLFPESYAPGSLPAAEPGYGEPCCELSRSPWDLLAEVSLNDPQEEDRLVETYLVQVARRAGWFVPSGAVAKPAETVDDDGVAQPRLADEFARKKKKKRPAKKAVVKKEEEEDDEKEVKPMKKKAEVKREEVAQVWTCKKNDGKLWHCRRLVSSPDSLCEYHQQKRAASNSSAVSADSETLSTMAAASKTSRIKKKTSSEFVGEGFYYYTGFAPSISKRHRRPTIVKHESSPVEQEEKASPPPEVQAPPSPDREDKAASPDRADQAVSPDREDKAASPEREDKAAPAAAPDQAQARRRTRAASRDDEAGCEVDIAGIAGVDEESSDDYTIPICNMSIKGDGKRKISPFKKRYRKPVKARSLKSLM